MRTIFFDSRGILRSGWRATLYLLSFAFAASILSIVLMRAIESLDSDAAGQLPISFVLSSFVSLTMALSLGWACAKYLEHLPFRSLGLSFTRYWQRDLGIGLILGAATITWSVAIA